MIQTCLTLKALFGLPLCQATGLVASSLKLAKLAWSVPDYSTLCLRQQDLTVTIPYHPSPGALHLLIDSTGIKAMGEGGWSCRKQGASRPRQWCKVHLAIDAQTLKVRAIEGEQANATGPREPANGSRVGDGPMLPKLLEQIPAEEPIGTVTADGGPTTPGSVTPPSPPARPGRSSGLPSTGLDLDPPHSLHGATAGAGQETTPGAHARNDILRASRRFGQAIWRHWSGYHQRSLVEAKMRCLKLPRASALRPAPPIAKPPSFRAAPFS